MYYAAFVGVATGRMMVVNKVGLVESLRWADRVVLKDNESRENYFWLVQVMKFVRLQWHGIIFEP